MQTIGLPHYTAPCPILLMMLMIGLVSNQYYVNHSFGPWGWTCHIGSTQLFFFLIPIHERMVPCEKLKLGFYYG